MRIGRGCSNSRSHSQPLGPLGSGEDGCPRGVRHRYVPSFLRGGVLGYVGNRLVEEPELWFTASARPPPILRCVSMSPHSRDEALFPCSTSDPTQSPLPPPKVGLHAVASTPECPRGDARSCDSRAWPMSSPEGRVGVDRRRSLALSPEWATASRPCKPCKQGNTFVGHSAWSPRGPREIHRGRRPHTGGQRLVVVDIP